MHHTDSCRLVKLVHACGDCFFRIIVQVVVVCMKKDKTADILICKIVGQKNYSHF
jgi:hypothetical protein